MERSVIPAIFATLALMHASGLGGVLCFMGSLTARHELFVLTAGCKTTVISPTGSQSHFSIER